jgi:hypothetical protein
MAAGFEPTASGFSFAFYRLTCRIAANRWALVRTRRLAAVHVAFFGVIVLVGSSRSQSADQRSTVSEVSLPGGLGAAMAVVGDGLAADRTQFLAEFIRRTHDTPFRQKDDPRESGLQALVAELNGSATKAGTADKLPLPLTTDVWVKSVFAGKATPQNLVAAILQSRNASLFYSSLLALDDDTRTWLAGQPDLISELVSRHALAFLAAAPGLRVASAGVSAPGGAAADSVWQALVEKRSNQPVEFVRALVQSNQGRLAQFFGAISQMTAEQIRLALNLGAADVSARVDSARRLFAVFQRVQSSRMLEQRAFSRATLDPTLLIDGFAQDDSGQLLVPGSRGFWNVVFEETDDGRPKPSRDDARMVLERNEPAEFAWLCDQVFKGSENDQRRRYSMVLFAARRLGPLTTETAQDAIDAVRAVGSFPVLTTALERAHGTNLKAFGSASRRAAELTSIADDGRAIRALTQFQGAVAIVTRAALRGSLDSKTASELVTSLSAVPVSAHGDYEGRLVRWLAHASDGAGHSASPGARGPAARSDDEILEGFGPREQAVLRLVSGPSQSEPQLVTWEGMRYRVDLARAESIRLVKALGESPRSNLSAAEAFADAADALAQSGLTRDRLLEHVQALRRLEQGGPSEGGEDGHLPAPERHREVLASLQRAAADGDVRAAARLAPALRAVADDRLARGLLEFAYAAALGERDGVSISASEGADRHDFGWRSTQGRAAAWRSPQPGTDMLSRWRVSGSILGLDVCLADFSLVRLSNRPPPRKPTLGDTDRRAFIDVLALVEPTSLTNADRDTIVAAMRKGRARLEAVRSADDAAAIADAAGVSSTRRTLLTWMAVNDPQRVRAFLSPAELFWAGFDQPRPERLNAWGAPGTPRLGCLCLRFVERRPWEMFAGRLNSGMMASSFSDLNLRLAELLSELQMPAPLLGPVLTSATLDFINLTISRDLDDRRGLVEFVQSLDTNRAEQYLALLTTDGPLMPVGEESKGSGGRR